MPLLLCERAAASDHYPRVAINATPLAVRHNHAWAAWDPEGAAAARSETAQFVATQRRQNLLDGLHVEAMQTRASKKRKRSMGMVGVISFCCGGGMLSSQWTGKNFKHIAGLDINPKYGKTFSKNTGGAPLVKCDLFKITRRWALQFKKKYDVAKYEKVVILASLDCCPASNANKKKLTKREKLVWYKKAIAKLKIFTDAMELGPTKVYLFHEFLDDADVIDLLEEAYPEIHKTQTTHHIFEDRRRAFLCQRYDRGMKEFDRELARGCSAYRRRSLVDELRKHGLDVTRDSEIFSKSWTKVEWRLDHDGRSLDCDRLPTITGQGLVLHVVVDASTTPPTVEEVPISPEIALKLRSLGGDRSFEFHSEDGQVVRAKIVGMGVSLVVAAAARRAFERCVLDK